jgi:16S rRNA processing protein RimM
MTLFQHAPKLDTPKSNSKICFLEALLNKSVRRFILTLSHLVLIPPLAREWTADMKRITIGQISKIRGIKGEVVVVPLTDDPKRFSELEKVFLAKDEKITQFEVEKARTKLKTKRLKETVLLKLKGVESPEEAKKLVGGFLEIEKEDVIKLPEGRYFIFDIIGLRVLTTDKREIGTVKEVISLPANDVYVVQGEKKEYDIPALKEVVKKIDLERKVMIIDPVEGLL